MRMRKRELLGRRAGESGISRLSRSRSGAAAAGEAWGKREGEEERDGKGYRERLSLILSFVSHFTLSLLPFFPSQHISLTRVPPNSREAGG